MPNAAHHAPIQPGRRKGEAPTRSASSSHSAATGSIDGYRSTRTHVCCQRVTRRVLLTGDEGTGTLAAVRALRAAGHEPWLAVSRPGTYAARSNAVAGILRVTDPNAAPSDHAAEVAAHARRLEVDAVLPGTEGSLRALTGFEQLFDGIALGTCGAEALDRATDKTTLARLAAEAGLVSPPTYELHDGDLPDGLGWPLVVKPVASVTTDGDVQLSREVRRVENRDELERATAAGGTWLAQPYLSGRLGAIGGVAWRGRLVCASHQVSPRIWPVDRGISSYAVTVDRDPTLEAGVARLLELVGWSGVFGVQFIHADDGAYVIDLNPRIYGSTALAVAAGHDLQAIWLELLLGGEPQVPPYRVGVRYRVEEDDVRAIVALRDWGIGLLPRRNTVHGVFALRDPRRHSIGAGGLLPR